MKSFTDSLHWIAVTLWVGGLWVIGYLVAPTLFNTVDSATAGTIAGKLFRLIAYVGFGCGIYLLIFRLWRFGFAALKQGFFWIVLVMLLLTAASYFGVQPIVLALKDQVAQKEIVESVFRERFRTWHGIASILYLIQSLFGVALVVLQRKLKM